MLKTRHFAQSSFWFTNRLTYLILLINRDIAVGKSFQMINYTLKQIVVFNEKQYYRKFIYLDTYKTEVI